MNRRSFLTVSAASVAAPAIPTTAASRPEKRPGLSIASYGIIWRKRSEERAGWKNALDVLEHCQEIGAGCLQIGIRGWEIDFARKVRDRRETIGVILEGQVSLPKKESDIDRFEKDLLAAKEAGAGILRTVCLGGRRYETFQDAGAWHEFVQHSRQRLEWAEPLARKHQLKLAVENHKDWRTDEFLGLLRHIESEWVGVNFDFGNNFALLEHPDTVAKALAPYIMTTHIKDMGLARYDDGFLLSEVPLGKGVLDLRKLMDTCEKKSPDVQFNLEMITRDPLKIPVLTKPYFSTLGKVPASDLSAILKLAQNGDPGALPTVTGKPEEEQITFEAQNVIDSLRFARQQLNLA